MTSPNGADNEECDIMCDSLSFSSALLPELHWLPVNPRMTIKLLTTGQPAYLRTLLHHYTPTHTLRSTNQFFPRCAANFH